LPDELRDKDGPIRKPDVWRTAKPVGDQEIDRSN
jgi:hypothetical protein